MRSATQCRQKTALKTAKQQEFVQKAREIEKGIYDIGAMYADKMLETGKEVLESEVKRYIKKLLKDIKPRIL